MIRTPRLRMRPATAATAAAELEGAVALAESLGVAVEAWPPPLHDEHSMTHYRDYLAANPERTGWGLWYLVLDGERPVVIGTAGFKGAPLEGCVEVGYSVFPDHQGRGHATEAVRALLAWAFDRDVEVVVAHTYPELTPSIRVLEKAGFAAEGPGEEEGTVRYRLTRPARNAARP